MAFCIRRSCNHYHFLSHTEWRGRRTCGYSCWLKRSSSWVLWWRNRYCRTSWRPSSSSPTWKPWTAVCAWCSRCWPTAWRKKASRQWWRMTWMDSPPRTTTRRTEGGSEAWTSVLVSQSSTMSPNEARARVTLWIQWIPWLATNASEEPTYPVCRCVIRMYKDTAIKGTRGWKS